jgi:sigma-E factor negative regulatory protein RseA
MTNNHDELLSAFVDGELQGDELDTLVTYLANNQDALRKVSKYQNSSDTIRGYAKRIPMIDLTAKISAEILKEETYQIASESKKKATVITFPKTWLKQVSSLAVAASVSAIAVVGIMSQPSSSPETAILLTDNVTPSEIIQVADSDNRWTIDEPEIEDRLNTYLVDHNEYAGASGVFSYARVVSYDSE